MSKASIQSEARRCTMKNETRGSMGVEEAAMRAEGGWAFLVSWSLEGVP